jgi:Glyoxalase-like domain
MPASLNFGQIAVDSEHADQIASFWSALLDRPLGENASDYFAQIPAPEDGTAPGIMFLKVPEPRNGKNRLHIDLFSVDYEADVARAIELGATRVREVDEYNTVWTTLADPEGNVFDIGRHQ